jgi:hypothetical protein
MSIDGILTPQLRGSAHGPSVWQQTARVSFLLSCCAGRIDQVKKGGLCPPFNPHNYCDGPLGRQQIDESLRQFSQQEGLDQEPIRASRKPHLPYERVG